VKVGSDRLPGNLCRPTKFGVTLSGMSSRDRNRYSALDDDDEKPTGAALGTRRRFEEFECPACSAHNPFDAFGNNDEVLCNWCGIEFKAVVDEEGILRLKET